MKLIAFLLAFLSAFMAVAAVDVQKSFLVSFDSNTDDSVVEKAKQMIIDAKGTITHEYRLIKGFAATAGEKVFESMQVFAQGTGATVEEDQEVSIDGVKKYVL